MKLLLLTCLVALAAARPQQYAADPSTVTIVSQSYVQIDANTWESSYELSDGTRRIDTIRSYPGDEPETGSIEITSRVENPYPEGVFLSSDTLANEQGTQVEADHLPVAPEAI